MIRYWVFAIAGLALAGAGLAVTGWGITSAFDTGNCVTSGTIQKIERCADGIGRNVQAIVGGTVVLTPLGIVLWALRGGHPRRSALSIVWVVYSLVFLITGVGMLWVAYGPSASGNDVIRQVGTIIGVSFLPIGLAPLLVVPLRRGLKARSAARRRAGTRAEATVVGLADTGMTVNQNPRLQLTLEVTPPGRPTFTAHKTAAVPRFLIPRTGDRIVVYYDPTNPGQVDIVWDERPATASGAPFAAPSLLGG